MVRRKGLNLACAWVLIAGAACAPKKAPAGPVPAEPQIVATVMTIQTTLQPQNKTFRHSIIIAGGRARSEDEVDRWRLFDLEKEEVTFVDDIDRTYRTEPAAKLIAERRAAARGPLGEGVPHVELLHTGAKRVIRDVETTQLLLRVGGYQRELWVGSPPSVPPNLYALMFGTSPADSKYEPMMGDADEELLAMRGFPLADHAELPVGNSKLVVDRNVVRIEQRYIKQSLLRVNPRYRELKAPGGSPRPASSPPRGRSTPEEGSRSSSTSQKNP